MRIPAAGARRSGLNRIGASGVRSLTRTAPPAVLCTRQAEALAAIGRARASKMQRASSARGPTIAARLRAEAEAKDGAPPPWGAEAESESLSGPPRGPAAADAERRHSTVQETPPREGSGEGPRGAPFALSLQIPDGAVAGTEEPEPSAEEEGPPSPVTVSSAADWADQYKGLGGRARLSGVTTGGRSVAAPATAEEEEEEEEKAATPARAAVHASDSAAALSPVAAAPAPVWAAINRGFGGRARLDGVVASDADEGGSPSNGHSKAAPPPAPLLRAAGGAGGVAAEGSKRRVSISERRQEWPTGGGAAASEGSGDDGEHGKKGRSSSRGGEPAAPATSARQRAWRARFAALFGDPSVDGDGEDEGGSESGGSEEGSVADPHGHAAARRRLASEMHRASELLEGLLGEYRLQYFYWRASLFFRFRFLVFSFRQVATECDDTCSSAPARSSAHRLCPRLRFRRRDVFELVRKLALTCVLSLVAPGSVLQACVGTVLAFAFVIIYALCKPYVAAGANFVTLVFQARSERAGLPSRSSERRKKNCPAVGWDDGRPSPFRTLTVLRARSPLPPVLPLPPGAPLPLLLRGAPPQVRRLIETPSPCCDKRCSRSRAAAALPAPPRVASLSLRTR